MGADKSTQDAMIEAEANAAFAKLTGVPATEPDDEPAVAAEDPQPTPISRDAFLGFPPSIQFIFNFRDIHAAMAAASGAGKSIKAPASKELVGLAAQYASLFTQIELQSRAQPAQESK